VIDIVKSNQIYIYIIFEQNHNDYLLLIWNFLIPTVHIFNVNTLRRLPIKTILDLRYSLSIR